jgi:CheY-like chemotaxis protein
MMLGRWLRGNLVHHVVLLPQAPLRKSLQIGRSSMETVLVIEDCPDIALLETDLIVDCGRRALIAADGVEALAILEGTDVDLILLDLNMPRLSGQAVLDTMTDHVRLRSIPVIVLSGNLAALRPTPQVAAMFPKPFDILEVTEAIERIAHSRNAVSVSGVDHEVLV